MKYLCIAQWEIGTSPIPPHYAADIVRQVIRDVPLHGIMLLGNMLGESDIPRAEVIGTTEWSETFGPLGTIPSYAGTFDTRWYLSPQDCFVLRPEYADIRLRLEERGVKLISRELDVFPPRGVAATSFAVTHGRIERLMAQPRSVWQRLFRRIAPAPCATMTFLEQAEASAKAGEFNGLLSGYGMAQWTKTAHGYFGCPGDWRTFLIVDFNQPDASTVVSH